MGCGWTVTAVSTGFAGVETAGVGTEGVGAGCAPLGCGGAAADLVFAILLGAGEEDLALLLAEAEVRAGACEAGGGATGAGGCGLLAGAGAGLGFLAGLGVGVDFALAVTAGAADAATDGDATGVVSETVRTTGAGAGVETGLAATAIAGAGAGLAGGGAADTLLALTGAAECATARGATRFAIETPACESLGSTNGGKSGKVLS